MTTTEVVMRSRSAVVPQQPGIPSGGPVLAAGRGEVTSTGALRQGQQVAYAVVLHFDAITDGVVRQAWSHLENRGVPSVSSTYGPGYRPHLTLAIVDTAHPGHVADRLRPRLEAAAGLPFTLSSLGFFLSSPAPAYLAVTPTRRLMALHQGVHDVLGAAGSWAYYRPGAWVPHCTLAMGVESQTAVARALAHVHFPVRGKVTSAHLTRLPRVCDDAAASGTPTDKQTSLLPAQHRAGPRHRRNRRILPSLALGRPPAGLS
jgi:hypothetical protein